MTPQTCRVLLVEDHKLLLEGLKALLAAQPDMQVIGEAHNVRQAKQLVEHQRPDFVVVDLSLVDSRGIDLVRHLARHERSIKILVFSHRPAWVMEDRVMAAGAHGYLRKSPHDLQIVDAIRSLMRGERFACASQESAELGGSSRQYATMIKSLSDREFEVFELVGQGVLARTIAAKLDMKTTTVRTLLDRIKTKLGVGRIEEVKRIAIAWQLDATV